MLVALRSKAYSNLLSPVHLSPSALDRPARPSFSLAAPYATWFSSSYPNVVFFPPGHARCWGANIDYGTMVDPMDPDPNGATIAQQTNKGGACDVPTYYPGGANFTGWKHICAGGVGLHLPRCHLLMLPLTRWRLFLWSSPEWHRRLLGQGMGRPI